MGYTYKDIIIDPTSKKAKNYIGKMVYFGDNPTACLNFANNNGRCKKLQRIEEGVLFPFVLECGDIWTCIIPKKRRENKTKD